MSDNGMIVGASVYTLDEERPHATAVAWKDGVVVAVGTDAEVRAQAPAGAETFDGRGLHVVPGLVDAHHHPISGVDLTRGVDLSGCTSITEVQAALAGERKRVGDGAWVFAWGLGPAVAGAQELGHWLIDEAVGDQPAVVRLWDVHTTLASRRALELARIRGPVELEGTSEVVCRDGRPTGALLELARDLLLPAMPVPTPEERRDRVAESCRRLNAMGITEVHAMDGSPAHLDLAEALEAEGRLTLRMVLSLMIQADTPVDEQVELTRLGDRGGRLWRGGTVKLFLDGVPETGTAWLREPDSAGEGLHSMWPDPADYLAAVRRFVDAGFQCATHAIGDQAVRGALDAYRAVGPVARAPHRVEHASVLPADLLERFATEGVVASMQPLHSAHVRADGSDATSQRLGPARMRIISRPADLVRSGATVALGSDWPIASDDPRFGMAWARLQRAPGAAHRDDEVVVPEQRLSAVEALRGYTVHAARAVGDGEHGGRIRVGGRADLTAFGADVLAVDADELPDVPVRLTMVDGRAVHRTA